MRFIHVEKTLLALFFISAWMAHGIALEIHNPLRYIFSAAVGLAFGYSFYHFKRYDYGEN